MFGLVALRSTHLHLRRMNQVDARICAVMGDVTRNDTSLWDEVVYQTDSLEHSPSHSPNVR